MDEAKKIELFEMTEQAQNEVKYWERRKDEHECVFYMSISRHNAHMAMLKALGIYDEYLNWIIWR